MNGAILFGIGRLAGLIGYSLFALTLFLNTRTKFLDKIFFGVNRAYVSHHNLGLVVFILLLVHPLALGFFTTGDLIILAGEIALLLLTILLVLTLFVNLEYQKWRFSHRFLALAFLFASLHVFFISNGGSLKIYILFPMALGFWSICYRIIFGAMGFNKYLYRVSDVNFISDNLVEVAMLPESKKINFRPGQFLFISFNDKALGREVHPFSISSPPQDEKLKITVKSLGDFTSRLKNLKTGTLVKIEGAFGKFSYLNYPPEKKQIWIAGGIGLTPYLSMARSMKNENKYQVDFYYCVKNNSELVFLDELKEINVIPFLSDKMGRITAEFIKEKSGGAIDKEIFLCGPPSMMESLAEQFLALGVKKKNIHTENFGL